ncbi:MAG: hypothetical protein ABIY55_26635, partial [Kofleriaceae bacterium]
LRGYQVELPPLRARRDDLGLLVATLLDRIDNRRAWTFRRAAARALVHHDWPLHVRELEQALRAAAATASGDQIFLEDLPATVRGEPAALEELPPDAVDLRHRFATLVLHHKGNVSHIALGLATSRSHVRRLAHRFGIDLDDARKT